MAEVKPEEVFYSSTRLRWIALIVVPLALLLAYKDTDAFFPLGIVAIVIALYVAFVPPVAVTSEGLRILGIYRLRWDDVRGATLRSYFGQHFLSVERPRRRPLSIPLDLSNGRSIGEALLLMSPPGNPIREALMAFPGTTGLAALPLRTPWKAILAFGGFWLASSVVVWLAGSVVFSWTATHYLIARASPGLASVPTPLPTPSEQPPVRLTPLTAYGVTMGIPCDIKGEPSVGRYSTFVACTNGGAISIDDPRDHDFEPWIGDTDLNRAVRSYLASAAGSDEPQAMMRAWFSLTADNLSWFTPPWTFNTVRYLLELKETHLIGREGMYELPASVRGFQLGTLDDDARYVEVVLFGPDSLVHRLGFLGRSASRPLTQADVLAVAASLQADTARHIGPGNK